MIGLLTRTMAGLIVVGILAGCAVPTPTPLLPTATRPPPTATAPAAATTAATTIPSTPRPATATAPPAGPTAPPATATRPATPATKPASPATVAPAMKPAASPTPAAQTSAGTPAAATPSATGPLQAGQQVATAVAPAPDGQPIYLVAGGALFQGVGAEATRVSAPFSGGIPLAVDDNTLVTGSSPACARGGAGVALRYSGDGGRTWQDAAGPGGRPVEARPIVSRGQDVYALDCAGVLESRDAGKSFDRVASLNPDNFTPHDLALSPDGSTAYVTAVSEGGTLQVVRAERGAQGWGQTTVVDTGWGTAAVAVGSDGRVVVASALAVRASTNKGASWQPISTGLEDELLAGDPTQGALSEADLAKLRAGVGVNDLEIVAGTVIAATNHGVYVSRQGGTWQRRPDTTAKVTRLQVGGQSIYATTSGGVLRFTSI